MGTKYQELEMPDTETKAKGMSVRSPGTRQVLVLSAWRAGHEEEHLDCHEHQQLRRFSPRAGNSA